MTADKRVVKARRLYLSRADVAVRMTRQHTPAVWACDGCARASLQTDAASLAYDLAVAAASDERAVKGVAW